MENLPFIAIDVETANLNNANICQLGVAIFDGEALLDQLSVLVNPESSFNPRFRAIHGITRESVRDALTWEQLYRQYGLFSGEILDQSFVVSHTYFDREAITKACERYGLPVPKPKIWLDTCAIARRVWPEMPNHKLATLAEAFGILYKCHDAGEDARCAGEVLIRAIRDSGKTMTQFMEEYLSVELGKKVTIEWKNAEDTASLEPPDDNCPSAARPETSTVDQPENMHKPIPDWREQADASPRLAAKISAGVANHSPADSSCPHPPDFPPAAPRAPIFSTQPSVMWPWVLLAFAVLAVLLWIASTHSS
ncbi:MAG: exonuclease domain-containing protein [Acidobacteriaceae bacterium]